MRSKTFLKIISQHEESSDIDHQLKLATAALLVEMMQQDDQVHPEEIEAAKKGIKREVWPFR